MIENRLIDHHVMFFGNAKRLYRNIEQSMSASGDVEDVLQINRKDWK